jgi:RHS repeat-associated protein
LAQLVTFQCLRFIEDKNLIRVNRKGSLYSESGLGKAMKTKNKKTNSRQLIEKYFARSIFNAVVVGSFLMFTGAALAQTQGSPDRGFQAGNGYAVSDIETINTTNGNLMLNIPLATLPAGRGTSPGFTLSLSYNSKLYNTKGERKDDAAQQGETGGTTYQLEKLYQSDAGGWHLGIGHSLKLELRPNMEAEVPCSDSSDLQKNAYIHKLLLVLPSGAETEFKPIGYGDLYGDGYFNISPFGELGEISYTTAGGGSGSCNYVVTQANTTGLNYAADDGSGARLFIPHVSPQNVDGSLPWTLHYPDGRIIEHLPADDSSIYERVTDRNGNHTYIKGITFNSAAATQISDDAGHSIIVQTNTITTVYSHGVGGELVPTEIRWKDQSVRRLYSAAVPGGPNDGLPSAEQTNDILGEHLNVIESITLPPQVGSLKYEFTYNAQDTMPDEGYYTSGWGELSSITLPSGAEVNYQYSEPLLNGSAEILKNHITDKTLTYKENYDGVETTKTDAWNYNISDTFAIITGPDGGATSQSFHGTWKTTAWDSGLVHTTQLPNGSIIYKKWISKTLVETEFTTIRNAQNQPSLTAIKNYTYDLNGNATQIKEYDFVPSSSITGYVIPTGAVLKRETVNEYYNPTVSNFDSSLRLKGILKSTEIRDGNGTPVSRSELYYDNPNTTGNLSETRAWDSTKGALANPDSNGSKLNTNNSISTFAAYNSYGAPILITDAKGVQTSIIYGNVAGPSGNVTDLYPTQTVAAYGTGIARTSTTVYDFYTGLVTSSTDEDNDLTNSVEYDDLGRPVKSITADGTALESWTVTEYDDADRFVVIKSDLETVGDGKKVAIQHFDQLGRVRLSRTLENAATESASNEHHGIKVQTRYATTYSSPNGYNYSLTSNPYRAATSSAASSDPTMGWTRSKAHHLGRHAETETFSGSALPAPWGSSTSTTGKVQTDIDANATTVTDQASKVRRSITNALGQLTRVDEPTSGGLGTVGSPNQATSYAYDTLNNLTTVTQGSQTRTFTYSSLSRLLTAANPESGTISYVYDSNGNLTTKTDARSIITTYTYDALNRVTARDYTGFTPDVTYTYDNKTHAVGKLTKISSSVSATEYLAFDILGRVTSHKQTTDSVDYTTGYTYNLSGALIEETYPSGRVVKNTIDTADGSLSQVQSKRSGDTYRNYANSFIYNAAGAITSMKLGNNRWETTQFNSRLQPTQIGLGLGSATPNILKLDYSYGTTANNGNVTSQTITVPGLANPFVQAYTYDELNRISTAEETNNSIQTWKQAFTYDRYGNRNFDEANTTTLPKNCGTTPNFTVCAADKKIVNPAIDPANNRLDTDDDYAFDNSGNTTTDAEGRTFVYDAENKQIEVIDNSVTVGEYFYDGDGKRIKKIVPATGETTIFVYDAAGKQVAEYSTIVQTGGNAKTIYTVNDHLGSPRINTDGVGAVVARHDYHPFGQEIATVQRTGGFGYATDTVRKQFTGYERDGETDLDFAQARYFNHGQGRFSTPDSFTNDSHQVDPQSWNLYSYVRNNPLNFVDPLGEKATVKSRHDKETNTTTVTITASFGVYGADGQGVSAEDLARHAQFLAIGISEAYNGTFTDPETGTTYIVNTQIDVQVYKDERAAIKDGIDNLVEVGNYDLIGDKGPSDAVVSYREGEDYDRMQVSNSRRFTGGSADGYYADKYRQTYAHEFAHVMGVPDRASGLFESGGDATRLSQENWVDLFTARRQKTVSGDPPLPPLRSGKRRPGMRNSPILYNARTSRVFGSTSSTYEIRRAGSPDPGTWVRQTKQ